MQICQLFRECEGMADPWDWRDQPRYRAALAVVDKVLQRHDIHDLKEDWVTQVVYGLGEAGREITLEKKGWETDVNLERRTRQKIHSIESLLAAYQPDRHGEHRTWTVIDGVHPRRTFPSEVHMKLAVDHGKDLEAILADLLLLLDAERRVETDLVERPAPPSNRPVTAKNWGAEMIFNVLNRGLGIDVWRACGMIAEMFAESHIGNGDRKKEQRALYDKLRRRVR
jgi:hypothetical protein